MKKILVWIVCLLIAALVAQLIPGCVHGDSQYQTEEELRSDARTVGFLTIAVYVLAIVFARGITKGLINKKDPKAAEQALKEQQTANVIESSRHNGDSLTGW